MKPIAASETSNHNAVILMTSHTIVAQLTEELKPRIAELIEKNHQPGLAVILVGHDPKSELYVNSIKQRQAEDLGISFTVHRFDMSTSEETILASIEELNQESTISGIIVQLPLPEQLDPDRILNALAKEKDVDGLRPGSPFMPPTVQAILKLLEAYDIQLVDRKIVVIGKGRLVGAPIQSELRALKLDVTGCDESTDDLAACTLGADILISATGVPRLVTPAMIKEGSVVIDVDNDVVYEQVLDKVAYITPQKGGVGPLTVTFLLSNVVEAAEKAAGTEAVDEEAATP